MQNTKHTLPKILEMHRKPDTHILIFQFRQMAKEA